MKTCDIVRDLLPLYCDGICSEESKRMVEAHLEACDDCKQEQARMQEQLQAHSIQAQEQTILKAAATAWKKGKHKAFLKGVVAVLVGVLLLLGGYTGYHWFSTAAGEDLSALEHAAAEYMDLDTVHLHQTEQKGNYLAALCTDENGDWFACVFSRDALFENRWNVCGGVSGIQSGEIGSWNYGSPQKEAVLVFCGGDISQEVRWYRFQNGQTIYISPVEDGMVLDLFIIPDTYDINGHPTMLDSDGQEITQPAAEYS